MRRAILEKQLDCVFLRNIFGFEALFPLFYFMQNREDRFQDYFGKILAKQ